MMKKKEDFLLHFLIRSSLSMPSGMIARERERIWGRKSWKLAQNYNSKKKRICIEICFYRKRHIAVKWEWCFSLRVIQIIDWLQCFSCRLKTCDKNIKAIFIFVSSSFYSTLSAKMQICSVSKWNEIIWEFVE